MCDHSFCYPIYKPGNNLAEETLREQHKSSQARALIQRSLLITLFAFSDNNLCLGCGPLLIGTAAVIRTVGWSKQRHICGESLRLEADQRKYPTLGAGRVEQPVIKIVPEVLSASC